MCSNIQGTDFVLENLFIGTVKLTKNADPDNFKHSRYGIEVDTHDNFSLSKGNEKCSRFGKNFKTFGTDMSSLVHSDDRKKYIAIFGERSTNGSKILSGLQKKSIL